MSVASISYSSLKNASNEAKAVAKKLDRYADSLYSNVYKKLNRYSGGWNSNVSTAYSKTNAKISELRFEQSRYEAYAADLIDLRDECKEVDKAVKSRVSSLTASFKEAYGIRNSKVENAINNFFTGLGNKTAVGRWLGGRKDDFSSGMHYFKDAIKEWYNYGGGKQLITGVLVGFLEVAIGVLAIVGAILSGGALLVIIAGVVGGVIAVANGVANIWNESKAYSATKDGDPATGLRRSEINTWQDYLRSSFTFGDSGENYHYNEFYNGLATGIDIVNEAVLVPTKQSSGFTFLKTGVWIVVAVIVMGSLLFQDNLFLELSWTARMLLIVLALDVTFLGGKKEYSLSPMELQFFDDHLVLYLPKRYYSRRVTRMEINQMKYSEISKCVFKTKSRRIHLYGNGTSTWYNYNSDGTIPKIPTQVKNYTAGLIYFNTQLAADVDFKTEIENHSPIQVIVENS